MIEVTKAWAIFNPDGSLEDIGWWMSDMPYAGGEPVRIVRVRIETEE